MNLIIDDFARIVTAVRHRQSFGEGADNESQAA
jgi:hypothetical protein